MRWLNLTDNPINDGDDNKLYLVKNEYGNLFFANYVSGARGGSWITKTKEPIASPEEGPIYGTFVTGYVPIDTDMLISNDDIKKKIKYYRKKAKRYKNRLVEEQRKQEKIFDLIYKPFQYLYLSGYIEAANALASCMGILKGCKDIDTEEEEELEELL